LTLVGVVPNPMHPVKLFCKQMAILQTLQQLLLVTLLLGTALRPVDQLCLVPQVGVGSSTYYAESSIGNCISEARTRVVLTIQLFLYIPGSFNSANLFSSSGTITGNHNQSLEYSIEWISVKQRFQGVAPGSEP
jgi:hypothetical protein